MPVYKYIGRNRKGNIKKGTIDTHSRSLAIQELHSKGIRLRDIEEVEATVFNRDITIGSPRVKNEDFVIYCRQFATLIRAGVTIVRSTNILRQQTESKALKKALIAIENEIKEGQSFSNAAEKHEKIFPSLFVNMIRSGEVTGNLDGTLDLRRAA
jgi:type IV pilus assembly protein PilC